MRRPSGKGEPAALAEPLPPYEYQTLLLLLLLLFGRRVAAPALFLSQSKHEVLMLRPC